MTSKTLISILAGILACLTLAVGITVKGRSTIAKTDDSYESTTVTTEVVTTAEYTPAEESTTAQPTTAATTKATTQPSTTQATTKKSNDDALDEFYAQNEKNKKLRDEAQELFKTWMLNARQAVRYGDEDAFEDLFYGNPGSDYKEAIRGMIASSLPYTMSVVASNATKTSFIGGYSFKTGATGEVAGRINMAIRNGKAYANNANVPEEYLCDHCHGAGWFTSNTTVTCNACKGQGTVTTEAGTLTCVHCNGSGVCYEQTKCSKCKGYGVLECLAFDV